jgi:hypothetical protein
VVSNRHKIIFIHVPKNAGTSIIEAFRKDDPTVQHGHVPISQYNSPEFDDYYKFALVRDPLYRLYSAYNYARMDESFWHKSKDGIDAHSAYHHLTDMSFEEHVDELWEMKSTLQHPAGSRPICRWSWDKQSDYLDDSVVLFPMEEMDHAIDTLSEMFPFLDIHKMNQSGSLPENFSAEIRRKVFEIYLDDYVFLDVYE